MDYRLISPRNGQPLTLETDDLLTDGTTRWPLVDGIAYLRDRDEVRQPAVAALRAGDVAAARRILLADQDRFSPTPPPERAALDELVATNDLTLRGAMKLLSYGPVADYFAYRWCSPTYVGGLHMLERTPTHHTVIEVACGIGHYLRALEGLGRPTVGIDIVWSKLWLARRYLNVRGPLVCGDIEAGPLVETTVPHTVFCHDAFYFFEHKKAALTHLRTLAAGGSVAVGHVHTGGSAHEAGFAQDRAAYAGLTDAYVRDDNDYVLGWYGKTVLTPDPAARVTAVGWIENETAHRPQDWCGYADDLRPNPLLTANGVAWPSEDWAREYGEDSRSLNGSALPSLVHQAAPADRSEQYRQRRLLNLPARW